MEQVPALAGVGVDVVRLPLRAFVRGPDDVPAALDEIATGSRSTGRAPPAGAWENPGNPMSGTPGGSLGRCSGPRWPPSWRH